MKRIMLDSEYFSDIENNDCINDSGNLDIDDFYFYYSNDILIMYEEIKENFTKSPFFLSNLTYPILTEFILDIILSNKVIKKNNLDNFNLFYQVEIQSSYNILNDFLRKFKKNIPYNNYLQFCFKLSDLHEFKNNALHRSKDV